MHGRIGLESHFLKALLLALPKDLLLFRFHLQPAFGVSLERLPLFRRKLEETSAAGLAPHLALAAIRVTLAAIWVTLAAIRVTHPAMGMFPALGEANFRRKNGERRDGAYNDEFSSHRLFSSEASNSSRSATTS